MMTLRDAWRLFLFLFRPPGLVVLFVILIILFSVPFAEYLGQKLRQK